MPPTDAVLAADSGHQGTPLVPVFSAAGAVTGAREDSPRVGGITMVRPIASTTGLIPLAVLGWLLPARPAAAQNEGYSVWQHRYSGGGGGWASGGGGWRSRSFYVPPSTAYYGYAPAFAPSALVAPGQSFYYAPGAAYYAYAPPVNATAPGVRTQSLYAPGAASPVNAPVTIDVTVPADAEIWIEGSRTARTGPQRRFVSPPLAPGRDYTYDFRVSWNRDGREVTSTRRITVHAGDVVNLTFPLG